MQGGEVLENHYVQEIAKNHDKTGAQVILRWHLQNNRVVIPKSVTPSRIEENFDVFDFELTQDEMEKLDSLDSGTRLGPRPADMNVK